MLTTCFRWIVLCMAPKAQRRAKVKSDDESSPYKRKNERRETAAKLHPALVILHRRLISLLISVCSTTSNPYGAILV